MTETLITKLSWGQMEITINGDIQKFKDCKIWPGGARAWDWKETGTEHQPGIQPADIKEILENDLDVLILSSGFLGRLGICAETEKLLHGRDILYHVEDTKKAVSLFNDLSRRGKRVGGVFHSTC